MGSESRGHIDRYGTLTTFGTRVLQFGLADSPLSPLSDTRQGSAALTLRLFGHGLVRC